MRDTKEAPWNVVWITGASSGIGLELARQLDGKVPHVVASARSSEKLAALAQQGSTIEALALDVADAQEVAACVEGIETNTGAIDLAILNASVWRLMEATHLDLAAIRSGVDTNYMGVVNAIAAVLPGMIARGSGHIAIVASVAGYRGLPRSIAYGPTKAALISLAETLRTELAPKRITISVVNPGFVDTPATRENPFPMPAIMPAPEAARRMIAGLARRRYEVIFPRRFVYPMKLLRLLPNSLYFWIVRNFIWNGQPSSG
jgi:NADP-dependent 3-hydroxy acid dehydrogenase YdfG